MEILRALIYSCLLAEMSKSVNLPRLKYRLPFLTFANLSTLANPDECAPADPQGTEMRDTEALGFVMLQLMERGRSRDERLALDHPDKWSPEADRFLQSTVSNSAKQLLSVRLLNPRSVCFLIVSARILEEFASERGTCEVGWLRSDIVPHPILS